MIDPLDHAGKTWMFEGIAGSGLEKEDLNARSLRKREMTIEKGQKQGSDNPEARKGTGKRKKREESIERRSNRAGRKANLMIVKQIYAKLRGSHLIAMPFARMQMSETEHNTN